MQTNIPKSVFEFLTKIEKNNNRDWFAENMKMYTKQHEFVTSFADSLLIKMNKYDQLETPSGKKACFRIYRDVRFSKNKDPYKTNMGIGIKRATAFKRGSYYINIKPGECFIGGGFWGPNPSDLKLLRKHIEADAKPLRNVLNSKDFKNTFGKMTGQLVKTSPKGFDIKNTNIDLLRYKQYLVTKEFKDREFQDLKFIKTALKTFLALRPFFDVMSEWLTTDLNGSPLYE